MKDKEDFRRNVVFENVRLSKEVLEIIKNYTNKKEKNTEKDEGKERDE